MTTSDAKTDRIFNTDVGNAKRLVQLFGDKMRYCHPWKSWLVWNGARWERDNTAEISRMAKETVKSIYDEGINEPDYEFKKILLKHALASESRGGINAMVEMAQSELKVPVLPEQLDTNQWLLNVRNGTIDLKTGKLREHRREDYITKITPVVYDPAAKCPTWAAFLKTIFTGNQNIIKFLKRAVGYSLTGSVREQILLILYGTGQNGKSTLMEIIMALLGDYAQETPTNTLLINKYDNGIPNDIARLKGARLVSANESEEGKRLAEAMIKQLTGGDTVTARFLHAEFFEFRPEFKIFFRTNHKPIIKGTDHAIWRRIRLIPFNVKIPEEDQDKDLLEKLRGELSGILNWAIEGCLEWQNEGLDVPEEVKQATQEYRDEMDTLGEFLNACCEFDSKADIPNKWLYRAYQLWCEAGHEKTESHVSFSRSLEERGRVKERKEKGMVWQGIRLKQDILDILVKVDHEKDKAVGLAVGCRLMKAFRGFSTFNILREDNLDKPTETYIPSVDNEKPTGKPVSPVGSNPCGYCGQPLNGSEYIFVGAGLGNCHKSCYNKHQPHFLTKNTTVPNVANVANVANVSDIKRIDVTVVTEEKDNSLNNVHGGVHSFLCDSCDKRDACDSSDACDDKSVPELINKSACEWEQVHRQKITHENYPGVVRDLLPKFPDMTADDLASGIRRYARITPGNNGNGNGEKPQPEQAHEKAEKRQSFVWEQLTPEQQSAVDENLKKKQRG